MTHLTYDIEPGPLVERMSAAPAAADIARDIEAHAMCGAHIIITAQEAIKLARAVMKAEHLGGSVRTARVEIARLRRGRVRFLGLAAFLFCVGVTLGVLL